MKIGDTARGRVSPVSPLSLILCPVFLLKRTAVTRLQGPLTPACCSRSLCLVTGHSRAISTGGKRSLTATHRRPILLVSCMVRMKSANSQTDSAGSIPVTRSDRKHAASALTSEYIP